MSAPAKQEHECELFSFVRSTTFWEIVIPVAVAVAVAVSVVVIVVVV